MELLDCCSETFDKHKSEFFNLLYGPILFYQDCNDEFVHEKFGSAFETSPQGAEDKFPIEADFVALIKRCKLLLPELFGDPGFSLGRKEQFNMLLDAYGSALPVNVRKEYDEFFT